MARVGSSRQREQTVEVRSLETDRGGEMLERPDRGVAKLKGTDRGGEKLEGTDRGGEKLEG